MYALTYLHMYLLITHMCDLNSSVALKTFEFNIPSETLTM